MLLYRVTVLTVPSLEHIVYDVVHETDLRFWYRTRGSVKHGHHYWQMIDFLFVSLKIKYTLNIHILEQSRSVRTI